MTTVVMYSPSTFGKTGDGGSNAETQERKIGELLLAYDQKHPNYRERGEAGHFPQALQYADLFPSEAGFMDREIVDESHPGADQEAAAMETANLGATPDFGYRLVRTFILPILPEWPFWCCFDWRVVSRWNSSGPLHSRRFRASQSPGVAFVSPAPRQHVYMPAALG